MRPVATQFGPSGVTVTAPAGGGAPRLRYLDLDILIDAEQGAYEARVIDSPVGESGPVAFQTPTSDLELENFLLKLGQVRPKVRGGVDSARTVAVKEFGGRLFDSLFHDDLLLCLRRSLDRANSEDCGLRLRLRLGEAPKLAELPWEFLYDRRSNRFLCLSGRTPIVRYLELPEAVSRDPMTGPLRMLVMISSPTDYARLDVEQEWLKLSQAVENLVDSGRLVVHRLAEPTLDALQRELRREEYHIFHYVGHGGVDPSTGEGVLVLADQNGRGYLESGQDLGALLLDERSLRLAVLNSCEGARADGTDLFAGSAQALVQQGIPAVVAMQFEITDRSAIAFSRNLYESLADGYPIDAATGEGRKAILALGKTEWATPVLYMRAPDGVLFDNPPAAVSGAPALPAPRPASPPTDSREPVTALDPQTALASAASPSRPAEPPPAPLAGQPPPPGERPATPAGSAPPPLHPVRQRRTTMIVLAAVGIAALFAIGAGVALGIVAGRADRAGPESPRTTPAVSQPATPLSPPLNPSSSASPAQNRSTGAAAAWAATANASCARRAPAVSAAFSAWLLSASGLGTGDVSELADSSQQLVDATRAQVSDLAMIAAPAEIASRVGQALALERRYLTEAEQAIATLRSTGDVGTYLARFQAAIGLTEQANSIWRELGATACTEVS